MKTIKNLTADQIRKSILQLAIQGKLVKQDPNDEPASELVKRIYEEKHKLIKEGKIKKDKNESYIYKGDDNCYYEKFGCSSAKLLENIPFELPNGWIWIRQSNLCWLDNGNKTQSGELPYLEAKVIRQNKPDKYQTSGVVVDSNFKLILVDGENSGEIFTPPFQGYMGSTFKILDVTLEIDFQYLLLIFELNLDLYRNIKTGAAIPHLNKKLFKENLIALPPLNEQQRIVKKLSEFDPLLERYQNIEKELSSCESTFEEKLKASILQYAIEGKLVKQDPNDEPASVLLERIKAEKEKLIQEGKIKRDKNDSQIPLGDDKNYYENIPNNWLAVPLKNLCALITCGYASTPKYEDNGIPFVSAKNVKPNKFIFSNYNFISEELFNKIHRNYVPEIGDILLTRVGAGIGEACIIDVNDKFGIYVSLTLIKPIYKLTNKYLLLVLQSPYGKTLSKKNTYGLDASQGNLNVDKVRKFIIPFPPINEQKRITMKINNIFNIFVS